MKKYIALTLAVVVTLCLWGCGRREPEPTPSTQTPDTTTNSEQPTDITPDPTMDTNIPDPTMDTNIPDPTVDSNSTEDGSLIDDITEMTKGG